MKLIEHSPANLILKDSAGCSRLFGLFFTAVAGIFIFGLGGMFYNLNEIGQFEKIVIWIIVLAVLSIGMNIIINSPGIVINFDKRDDKVIIKKKKLFSSSEESFPLKEIIDIKLLSFHDSEGGPVYEIEMILTGGRKVILNNQTPDNVGLQNNIDLIKNFL